MAVVWITGLSGSGKTTLAKKLSEQLKSDNIDSIKLDGDQLRSVCSSFNIGYSICERRRLGRVYSKFAKLLSDQGNLVIVSTIAMFEDIRQWNRNNNKDYLEIYLKGSMKSLYMRDNKNIYSAKKNYVKIGDSYEEPLNPDLVFDINDNNTTDEMIRIICSRQSRFFKGIANKKYCK